MPSETLTTCPFCKKETIRVLHIPFVKQTITSKCRAGGRNTRYQHEKFEVISGCSACGKSKEEVEKALNGPLKKESHEERLKRLRESGIPTVIETPVR